MIDLTLACGLYDRTEALRDGRVGVEGVRLTYLALEAEEAFWRMLRYREFDASEMSLGAYVSGLSRGRDDLAAIPVFPSRLFRHAAIYVPSDSSVTNPAQLAGRRIGVPEYRMTAGVWVRGLLSRDFGLAPTDVTWVEGGLEEPGREAREPGSPLRVAVVAAPEGRSLSDLLANREIDALVSARVPSSVATGHARRLFADPWSLERDYYRRTAIFPIMHTVVFRTDVLSRHPWLARSLFKAFAAAKDIALAELFEESALRTMLPFQLQHAHEALSLMGPDPWPYGLEPNRDTLNVFIELAAEQGLLAAPVDVDSLFVESTLREHRI